MNALGKLPHRTLVSLAGLTAILALGATPAGAATQIARPSDAFVDSIGVNTHTYYTGTVYYRQFPQWKAKLEELGVRHIRENLVPNRSDQYQRLNELAEAGVRSTLIIGDPREGLSGLEALLSIAKNRIRGSLAALEGPNEFDLRGDPIGVTSWLPITKSSTRSPRQIPLCRRCRSSAHPLSTGAVPAQ